MLRKLILHHVGPTERLALDPVASRLNLIVGDNGLGKSFLLEAAWWALTRTWHEAPAVPSSSDAMIEHEFDGQNRLSKQPSTWDPKGQQWKRSRGKPANPGLVLYARVDGSFSVWDPARNYRLYRRADGGQSESPAAYQFTTQDAMWGLKRRTTVAGVEREETLCLGLVDEWREWQRAADPRFDLLRSILAQLGPDEQPLVPGELIRPTLDNVREIPTVRMPYGQDVPITYAPAGVTRMSKLAYLLAWALSEHEMESDRVKQPPSPQVIVLVDEPETHLHPRWQRTIVPSLLQAVQSWRHPSPPDVQFLIATHAPLVLASLEPTFDPALDALWKLDLVKGKVQVERDVWHKRGDVNRWLKSDVFDLPEAMSREAEKVVLDAGRLMGQTAPDPEEVRQFDARILDNFSNHDPFFLRWRQHMSGVVEFDDDGDAL